MSKTEVETIKKATYWFLENLRDPEQSLRFADEKGAMTVWEALKEAHSKETMKDMHPYEPCELEIDYESITDTFLACMTNRRFIEHREIVQSQTKKSTEDVLHIMKVYGTGIRVRSTNPDTHVRSYRAFTRLRELLDQFETPIPLCLVGLEKELANIPKDIVKKYTERYAAEKEDSKNGGG